MALGLIRLAGLLALLTVAIALPGVTANTIDGAFIEFFGQAAANETSREALISHLDRLLALGASKPGEKLLHLHEYNDPRARQLGTSLAQSLKGDNLDQWADSIGPIISKLDEGQTFSLVRRLIVAAALKYWLQHGQNIPDSSAEKLRAVFLKLYEKHRVGAINKGIMEYLHVSKSGGTSWCHVAQLNGCVTERYDKSYVCQIKKFDDKVRWLNMTFHMMQVPVYRVPQYVLKRFSRYGTYRKNHEAASCGARKGLMAARDYNYYSNEYTVHGGHKGMDNAHVCGSFFNAIVMRDPLKRLVSHLKFVMWTMSGDRGYNDTMLFKQMYDNRTSAFWQELGPAMVDNYFIRSLLGEEAFHVPVGRVNDTMLQLAELVLAQFDLVLALEQSEEVRNLILYYGVGWKHTMEEVHDKDSDVREAEFNTTRYIPPDISLLLQRQDMDRELYLFSRTLAQLDPVVFYVAKAAAIQPLPPAFSDPDNLQCGLLRGQNRTYLLTVLGLKAGHRLRRAGGLHAAHGVRGRTMLGLRGKEEAGGQLLSGLLEAAVGWVKGSDPRSGRSGGDSGVGTEGDGGRGAEASAVAHLRRM